MINEEAAIIHKVHHLLANDEEEAKR